MSRNGFAVRRTASLAAGLTAVAALGLAGTPAHALVRPATCTVVDIGQPAKIYAHGMYAGEVEQQYDNCHNVRSHYQWSSAFRSTYPGSSVFVDVMDHAGDTAGSGGNTAYQGADVYSSWVYIYTYGADTWAADAGVNGPCTTGDAVGDWHDYSNGAEFGAPANASC